jgi:hypothetical protein
VILENPPSPKYFILDGQQRLTALFQSLLSDHPVATKDTLNRRIFRWYYIRIDKALNSNGDRDEAFIALPPDRLVRNFRGEVIGDYSTIELECKAELMPLSLVFNTTNQNKWMMRYLQMEPNHTSERLDRWGKVLDLVIQPFQHYQVPIIALHKETRKGAVCQVFEKVNTGGVTLNVFELLTATFAADNFNLRDDWREREKRMKRYSVLNSIQNTDFLQVISLLTTYAGQRKALDNGVEMEKAPGISCKRESILKMTLEDYKSWADTATLGFELAAKFLHTQKIYSARELPYRTQLVPLAAILATLGSRAEEYGVLRTLARWFWCGVFGELYGGAIESRFAKDLPEVVAWILRNGLEPDTVASSNFSPGRLLTLRTRNSAAYKGLSDLLLRDGAQDFRSGMSIDVQTFFDEKFDIHHIFPQVWCGKNKIDSRRCDSTVNKTPLSAKTNRMIGGNAPSTYLPRITKNAGIDDKRMDEILRTHVIDPQLARSDDFDSFFDGRQSAILERIERATGKKIARETVEQPVSEVMDVDEEEINGNAAGADNINEPQF